MSIKTHGHPHRSFTGDSDCHCERSKAISCAAKRRKIASGTGILPVTSQWTCWKPLLPFTPRDDRGATNPRVTEWILPSCEITHFRPIESAQYSRRAFSMSFIVKSTDLRKSSAALAFWPRSRSMLPNMITETI